MNLKKYKNHKKIKKNFKFEKYANIHIFQN